MITNKVQINHGRLISCMDRGYSHIYTNKLNKCEVTNVFIIIYVGMVTGKVWCFRKYACFCDTDDYISNTLISVVKNKDTAHNWVT